MYFEATENWECKSFPLICPQCFYNIHNQVDHVCVIGSVAEESNVRRRIWKVMMHPINLLGIFNAYVSKHDYFDNIDI